jgi:hypothetical protein
MTDINTGGPAFPTTQYAGGIRPTGHDGGMTLRDYFAAKALSGLIGLWTESSRHLKAGQTLDEFVSEQAYAYADSMLKARQSNG